MEDRRLETDMAVPAGKTRRLTEVLQVVFSKDEVAEIKHFGDPGMEGT